MNRKTVSKTLPIVVVSFCSLAAMKAWSQAAKAPTGAAAGSVKPGAATGAGNVVLGNLITPAARVYDTKSAAYNDLKKDCKDKENERATTRSKFLVFCQNDLKQKAAKKGTDDATVTSRNSALQDCVKELDECRSAGDSEMPLYSAASGMNTSGASAFMPLGDDEENPKRCSDYSKSEYRTELDKLESNLDKRKKDYENLVDKSHKDEESFQDKYNRLQKEMAEEQKNKTKSDYASKDEDRKSKAELEKQRMEFDSKVRQTDLEIFQLQQQQSLLTTQRGKAVSNYQKALLKCQSDYETALAAPKALRSGLSTATVSPAKKIYIMCREDAVKDRNMQAEAYESEFAKFNKMISVKMQELQAAKTASDQMSKMYSEAMQEKANQKNTEDQQFLSDQQQKFTQMTQMATQQQSKAFQTQQLIADAQTSVTMASNKLDRLQSETPRGNKPLEEIQGEAMKYDSIADVLDVMCNGEKSDLKKAKTELDDAEKALNRERTPAQSGQGADGG